MRKETRRKVNSKEDFWTSVEGMRLKVSLIILPERRLTLYIGGWLTFRHGSRKPKQSAFQQSDVMSVGMNGYIAYLTPIPKSLAPTTRLGHEKPSRSSGLSNSRTDPISHSPFLELC